MGTDLLLPSTLDSSECSTQDIINWEKNPNRSQQQELQYYENIRMFPFTYSLTAFQFLNQKPNWPNSL